MLVATSIDVIFDKFLSQIDDIELSLISDEDMELLLIDLLENATVEFKECKKDLSVNLEEGCVMADLTLEEVYILALSMKLFWLSPKINREENLRQIMQDRDFKQLSNANMLKALLQLQQATRKELNRFRQRYSYNDFKGFD